jgi:hypothetical protein
VDYIVEPIYIVIFTDTVELLFYALATPRRLRPDYLVSLTQTEHVPMPTFLTTVGKISAEYT